jgi:L-fuconolactonase
MPALIDQADPEPIVDPDLPIVDAHHHLWYLPEHAINAVERDETISARGLAPMYRSSPRYLFDEFMADVQCGHDVRASVYVEAASMYRRDGPSHMRSVGEVEFANGVAAMGASALWGEQRPCAGIVGRVDLTLGAAVEEILAAHIQAGGDRYRGVRPRTMYDDDGQILTGSTPRLLLDSAFRRGVEVLCRLGLSLDLLVLEPQLPEVIDLARAFEGLQIVLNHAGVPVGVGRYAGRRGERFPIWRDSMRMLASCSNVAVKLGGFGIVVGGSPAYLASPRFTSAELAQEWRPYVETCIDAFGPDRCMFESNFPPDSAVGSYRVVWNAFKRLVVGASDEEKAALFGRTAIRTYRLDLA